MTINPKCPTCGKPTSVKSFLNGRKYNNCDNVLCPTLGPVDFVEPTIEAYL